MNYFYYVTPSEIEPECQKNAIRALGLPTEDQSHLTYSTHKISSLKESIFNSKIILNLNIKPNHYFEGFFKNRMAMDRLFLI